MLDFSGTAQVLSKKLILGSLVVAPKHSLLDNDQNEPSEEIEQ